MAADLTFAPGFKAQVFAEATGNARHIAARPYGEKGVDLYIALRRATNKGGIIALRDKDGDGVVDEKRSFGDMQGTGIAIYDGHLYFGTNVSVVRFKLGEELVPDTAPQTIVKGFPEQRQHASKTLAFDDKGGLYVNVGAPSNACQVRARSKGSPGQNPCPQLERQAGIWRFDAHKTGQDQEEGVRYATGIRNAVALDWDKASDALYFVQHGRDQLSQLWPDYFTDQDNAEMPAEEFHRATQGSNHGWPFTYYDPIADKRVLAPEYGGDGEKAASEDYADPLIAFPGHWAPNDLLFYTGDAFPEAYQGGAFIAFHGSWNRAPLPQGGYKVVFVPMKNGEVAGEWSVFADGFKGADVLESPGDADYRPMGLAQGPDGALYIADSVKGRIWKVTHDAK